MLPNLFSRVSPLLSPLSARQSPIRKSCSALGRRDIELIRTPTPSPHKTLLKLRNPVKTDFREMKLSRLKQNLGELTSSRERLRHKQNLLKLLERSHKVKMGPVDCRMFSENQLVTLALVKQRRALASTATSKLRHFTSSQKLTRGVTCQNKKANIAATLIQRQWRLHQVRSTQLAKVFKANFLRRGTAATVIQRHVRGYL